MHHKERMTEGILVRKNSLRNAVLLTVAKIEDWLNNTKKMRLERWKQTLQALGRNINIQETKQAKIIYFYFRGNNCPRPCQHLYPLNLYAAVFKMRFLNFSHIVFHCSEVYSGFLSLTTKLWTSLLSFPCSP